jgi:hypothetical protein
VRDHGLLPLLLVLAGLLGLATAAGAAPADRDEPAPARATATRADLAEGLRRIADARAGAWQPRTRSDAAETSPAPSRTAVEGLARRLETRGAAPVSARLATRMIVATLGLRAERAALARLSAGGVRLRHRSDLPSEVLVRELGIRENRPTSQDGLERTGRETLFRTDLDGMVSRAAAVRDWDLQRVGRFREIALPAMGPRARVVVEAALRQVGQPYVWAGDAPTTRSAWGPQAHGGFDCSGLVWWSTKGDRRAAAAGAGREIGGRTADAMAWERPRDRIAAEDAAAGDLVFFGAKGPKTGRGAIEHVGIALGGGWMIHSAGSRGGPSISHLDDYWPSGVVFARAMRLG